MADGSKSVTATNDLLVQLRTGQGQKRGQVLIIPVMTACGNRDRVRRKVLMVPRMGHGANGLLDRVCLVPGKGSVKINEWVDLIEFGEIATCIVCYINHLAPIK